MESSIQKTRLSISLGDFRQARKFASFVLRRQLHTKTQTDHVQLLHLAFNTSLVVSYSRPFGLNREIDKGRSSLKLFVPTVLTPEEITLHDTVLEFRNTAYGHSDASSHLLSQLDYTQPGFKP